MAYNKKNLINIVFPVIGIIVAVLQSTCEDSCAYLKGSIFGLALNYIGFFFMGALVIFQIIKKELAFLSLLSTGVGAELYLLGFQITRGVYCYYCLAFGAILFLLFFFNFERSRKIVITVLLMIGFILFSFFFEGSVTPVYADSVPMTSFGNGRIKVRLYTDYFCNPCRSLEPELEPLLVSLVKKGSITVTFVDTPVHPQTLLYAKKFLYALNEKKDLDTALYARHVLFEAAKQNITEDEKLNDFLRRKRIKMKSFDPKDAFGILSSYIREDMVNSTPTCVIYDKGKKEKFIGSAILKALQSLK